MPAMYYSFASGKDVFVKSLMSNPIRIDFLDAIVGQSGLAIYTEVSAQLNETIQFFLTFDDIVKYFHFGKGLGNITIAGIIFMNCSGEMPGITQFFSQLGQNRGQLLTISIGATWFQGVISSATIDVVGDPDTMANFSITLAMTNHGLPKIPPTTVC